MERKNEQRRTRPSGFTLVELMVVIAIMGILAGAVTLKVFKSRDKAKAATAKADIQTLKMAAANYNLQNGKSIGSLQDLVPDYIEEVKKDPWGEDYTVSVNGDDVKISCNKLGQVDVTRDDNTIGGN